MYRGPIAIHAGKMPLDKVLGKLFLRIEGVSAKEMDFYGAVRDSLGDDFDDDDALPCGAVIATAELVECWACGIKTPIGDRYIRRYPRQTGDPVVTISIPRNSNEMLFGDFSMGRYAWEFANLKLLPEPIPARGQQGLWEWRSE